jgi:hypothetical protein
LLNFVADVEIKSRCDRTLGILAAAINDDAALDSCSVVASRDECKKAAMMPNAPNEHSPRVGAAKE